MAQLFGFMQQKDANGDENAIDFAIRQVIKSSVQTAKIVKVTAVDSAARTVDVQPLTLQVTPNGSTKEMPTVCSVPYGYEQAGTCLIRVDPIVGDVGLIVCADRDISRLKALWNKCAPATLRTHNLADAVYVRTLYTGQQAAHEIQVDPNNGVTITSSLVVQVKASAKITGDLEVTGTITGDVDVKAAGISLKSHVHSGVQSGSSETGEPQ